MNSLHTCSIIVRLAARTGSVARTGARWGERPLVPESKIDQNLVLGLNLIFDKGIDHIKESIAI